MFKVVKQDLILNHSIMLYTFFNRINSFLLMNFMYFLSSIMDTMIFGALDSSKGHSLYFVLDSYPIREMN